MSESYLEIQLDQQPIELCKLLKIANLVAGGGEAKVVISEGYVLLNGEIEYQKRKKVYDNDIVEFNGETLQIIVNENLENELNELNEDKIEKPTQTKSTASFTPKQEPKQEQMVKPVKKLAVVSNDEPTAKKGKRKPISF
jgi:ribosome-associated protein